MVHNGSAPHTPPTTPPLSAPATEQVGSLGTNGRSSGRKRTPKACDCCGPNSRHHDNKTPQTGKARRGRPPAGRGKGQDLGGDTPKRKGRTPIKKPLQNEQQVVGLTCRLGEVNNTVVVEEVTNSVDQQITISLDDPVRNSTDEQVTESEMEQEEGEGCSEGERVERVAGSEREQQEAYLDNEPSQGTDSNMEVVPQTSGGEPALSNGRPTSTPPDESSTTGAGPTSVPMEVEPSAVFCLSPCITLHTIHNPFALWDHIHYCKPGVWASGPGDEEGEAPLAQTAQQELCPADMNHEGIRDLIHEFLEHFYVKYGSFIPLSEGDVLEHLKTKCNTDLNNGKFNIHSEVVKYKAGLASAPMHCFKVTYNKHTLTLEDLSTLDDQNWVNDQVINMYGELIMEATQHKVHFFNSFFHRQLVAKGYEGVKRWTKKVDLFSKRLLMIPIHLEIHWSLITVDIASHHINYYDSQGVVFKYTVDNIMRYILAEAKEKQQAGYQKGWKMIVNKGIPQQKNDSDCGVFVLEYCKCLALKEPLQFTQEDMPKFRKRIYKELCDCKLTV